MKRSTRNDTDRREWVMNYEELYRQWKASRGSVYTWVKNHRKEIDAVIDRELNKNRANDWRRYV